MLRSATNSLCPLAIDRGRYGRNRRSLLAPQPLLVRPGPSPPGYRVGPPRIIRDHPISFLDCSPACPLSRWTLSLRPIWRITFLLSQFSRLLILCAQQESASSLSRYTLDSLGRLLCACINDPQQWPSECFRFPLRRSCCSA